MVDGDCLLWLAKLLLDLLLLLTLIHIIKPWEFESNWSDEDRVKSSTTVNLSAVLYHCIENWISNVEQSFIGSIVWGQQKERVVNCEWWGNGEYSYTWDVLDWIISPHNQSAITNVVVEANRREIDFLLFVICGGIWQQHNLSLVQTICLRQFSLYRIKACIKHQSLCCQFERNGCAIWNATVCLSSFSS